ncbi:MAG TPA: glycoside hydrolase family 2 TIM barrel-domain containing protein [Opitutaceae bacterium]|jgi:beta-galactosidase
MTTWFAPPFRKFLRWPHSPILALIGAAVALLAAPLRASDRESFDFDWRFVSGDTAGAEVPGFDDASWRKLAVPHDWSIEGPFDAQAPAGGPGGYLPTGIGWYRKHFQVPAAMKGRVVTIQFDGVYMNSDVWINGKLLGHRPFGYITFRYDLTPYLNYGGTPNVLAVRVDTSRQPSSRWYAGSGIDRNVWMLTSDPLRIVEDGIVVTTPETAPSAVVRVRTQVINGRPQAARIELRQSISGEDGPLPETTTTTSLQAGSHAELESALAVPHPRLWSPDHPSLYVLHSEVWSDGHRVDSADTTIGIRSLDYDVDRGFRLNGEPTKMFGLCLHQDAGPLGSAVPAAILESRLRDLKAMGCNAIRTSHNPPDPVLLDLCDRLGLLVMDEAFDEWTQRKPQISYGYSDFFAAWSQRDLQDFIRRDRNHPSVVLWSAGNEVGEQLMPAGPSVLKPLVDTFHREDPTRPVTSAMDNVYTDHGRAPTAFTDLLDIVGYNYADRWLARRETYMADDRVAFPQRRFVGTEDAGTYVIRGTYPFGSAPPGTPERALYAAQDVRIEQLWKFALTHDYDIGHFMWTGFDYLGESRWPEISATCGALDFCGFRKDAFYLYQSIFTHAPMLHLLPHWNWAERAGQVIPVLAYTNCDVVELFLNGRSLGAKAREFPREGNLGAWNTYPHPQVLPTTADLHLQWDVPYAAGELRAVGYRGGEKVCEEVVRTAGAATALSIAPDRLDVNADGRDALRIEIRIVDAHGVTVPTAADAITVAIDGPAKLLGIGNGDPANHESFQASHHLAFNGLCLAIIGTTRQAGTVRVTVSAPGLAPATAVLRSQAVPMPLEPFTAIP